MKVVKLHTNETELISLALKNNRRAQHNIYELHAPKMLSVCRYYINDLQQAEDVMLQGFFKVFSNLKSFKNEGSFQGWIRRIMVRECISFLRQNKHLEFSIEDATITEVSNANAEGHLNAEAIQDCIDRLPEGYKMVFVLYAIEGYKHAEIAEMLNISEGTSKSQLSKARNQLQKQIKVLNQTRYGSQ